MTPENISMILLLVVVLVVEGASKFRSRPRRVSHHSSVHTRKA